MPPFDYSKWDKIELSDDESDCHPNIDKESWFRLKHRTRVEREEKEEKEKNDLTTQNNFDLKRILQIKELLKKIEGQKLANFEAEEDPSALESEISSLEKDIQKRKTRLEELEKNKKWNWENMCHVVEERTIVTSEKEGSGKDTYMESQLPPKLKQALNNKNDGKKVVAGPASAKQEIMSYSDFVEKYENLLEKFSEIKSLEKTEEFLLKEGGVLFAEHSQNYLLLSCLEDEMNSKHSRAKLVARQSQILSNITELAVGLKRPPQDVVKPFFVRLGEAGHKSAFETAVSDFVSKVRERAKVKRKEMDEEKSEEVVELSKEERLGPGGLDPVEVFESLPKSLQDAFDTKSIEALKEALAAMTPDERAYHMKRCEDSGLWVSGKKEGAEDS